MSKSTNLPLVDAWLETSDGVVPLPTWSYGVEGGSELEMEQL